MPNTAANLLQFLERELRNAVARRCLQLHGRQRASHRTHHEPSCDLEFGTHEQSLVLRVDCVK